MELKTSPERNRPSKYPFIRDVFHLKIAVFTIYLISRLVLVVFTVKNINLRGHVWVNVGRSSCVYHRLAQGDNSFHYLLMASSSETIVVHQLKLINEPYILAYYFISIPITVSLLKPH